MRMVRCVYIELMEAKPRNERYMPRLFGETMLVKIMDKTFISRGGSTISAENYTRLEIDMAQTGIQIGAINVCEGIG